MSALPSIAVFAQSAAIRSYLEALVRLSGAAVAQEGNSPDMVLSTAEDFQSSISLWQGVPVLCLGAAVTGAPDTVRFLKTPVRAAHLLDAIEKTIIRSRAIPARIPMAGGILDTQESLWLPEGGEQSPVRLTEKEVGVLLLLRESFPLAVSRQTLLDKVWAYADGVETHTLETHIYRLRQKIEIDPSSPTILLTTEDGYCLGNPV